jgi:Domain of Unknown Function with PDB structure (DUF3857)
MRGTLFRCLGRANVSSRILLVFALLLILPFPKSKVLADEWQPIDPADLKMTSEPKAPGAPAIYLYRQVDRKDASRAATEYNYVRIKILTEEGRDRANVAITYSDREHVAGIRARTIHPDGRVINFDGQVFDKIVEKTKGVKVKAKVFTAPDVQVGSIIEYHFNYDFEDQYIFNSYWPVSDELFTRKAVFSLVPFKEWPVRWDWPAGLPAGTAPPKTGPDGILRMTATDVPAFLEEEYMPPENELKFRVIFIYSEDGFEMDPQKFWHKFDKKEYGRMESFIDKKKELEAAVSQITAPNDPPDLKLRKIYTRVEQLRNLSFEPPRSEQEAQRDKLKKNDNAADVLKNGYGYGYEITWTFLALARAAGLESYGLMLSRRNEYFFNEKRMDKRELDSNAVLVKVNGKDLFFDPGAMFVPYGLLPWEETGVKGMKLDKDGGSWIVTTLAESSASQIVRAANLKLDDQGNLEGSVTLTFTGLEAWSHRVRERNEDDQARKKALEEELKGAVTAATEVELSNQPDWKSTEAPLVAEFHIKIPGWVSSAGHRALLPVGIFSAPEKQIFSHAERVYPICFSYPYQKKDDVKIELPSGWTISNLPKPIDRDAKDAEYVLKAEGESNQLHITRSVRSDLYILPKDTYPALRGFYQAVRSGDDQQIVLQPAAVAASH